VTPDDFDRGSLPGFPHRIVPSPLSVSSPLAYSFWPFFYGDLIIQKRLRKVKGGKIKVDGYMSYERKNKGAQALRKLGDRVSKG
jgi:hypothetical protein